MMRTTRSLCALALLLLACGDREAETSTGGGGTVGGTGSGGQDGIGANGASGSGGNPTGGAGAGSTGGAAPECRALKNADDPSPTPGVCDGNTAVTCGQDGELVAEPCTAGSSCQTYPLVEYRWDPTEGSGWIEGRPDLVWAGCIPDGAEPCATPWNGDVFKPTEPPRCEGIDQVRCLLKPAPNLFDNTPQLYLGAVEGYVSVVGCAAGLKCALGDVSLTCIDEATPDCDGSEPACSADGTALKLCHDNGGSPGYVVVEPCSAGEVCYEGTISDFCAPPGKAPCDDAATPRTCSVDGSAIEDCYNGWTRETSCALCPDAVSCRCDEVASIESYDCSESFAVEAEFGLDAFLFGDVAGDLGGADDAARVVLDG